MSRSRFESLGVYLPEKIVTTAEIVEQIRNKPEFDLEELTGIRKRRHGNKSENTYSITLNAVKDCLNNSKYKAEDLDIIITCSISRFDTQDRIVYEPSVALRLKEEIGATNATFFSIANACAGMGTGVHLLDKMIKAGTVKNGMVVSGESITRISDTAVNEIKEPIDFQFGSLTVGDAGACVILEETTDENDDGVEYSYFATVSDFSDLCFGMPSNETGQAAMYTDSIGIHRESIGRLAQFIQAAFKIKREPQVADKWDYSCKWLIPHQTSRKAMRVGQKILADYFNIDWDYWDPTVLSRYVEDYGNTASTSHFLVLYKGINDGLINRGDKIILLFQASGIVLGIISVKLGDLDPKGKRKQER